MVSAREDWTETTNNQAKDQPGKDQRESLHGVPPMVEVSAYFRQRCCLAILDRNVEPAPLFAIPTSHKRETRGRGRSMDRRDFIKRSLVAAAASPLFSLRALASVLPKRVLCSAAPVF